MIFVSHREYCKDLKPPDGNENNTEFLMRFNTYIDTKTPNNPMCEYLTYLFSTLNSPGAYHLGHFPQKFKASTLDLHALCSTWTIFS